MEKEYVAKIADDILKGQFHDPHHLLFLVDMACEYFYEYRSDLYDILVPALHALEKSIDYRVLE